MASPTTKIPVFTEFSKNEPWQFYFSPGPYYNPNGPWTRYASGSLVSTDWNTLATYYQSTWNAGRQELFQGVNGEGCQRDPGNPCEDGLVKDNDGTPWDIYTCFQLPRGLNDERDLSLALSFYMSDQFRHHSIIYGTFNEWPPLWEGPSPGPHYVDDVQDYASMIFHYTEHDAVRGYWLETRTTISGVSNSEWVSIPRAKIYVRMSVDESDKVHYYWSFLNDPRDTGANRTGLYWTEITPSGDRISIIDGWVLGLYSSHSGPIAPLGQHNNQTRATSLHVDFVRDINNKPKGPQKQIYETDVAADGRILIGDPIED